VRIVRFFLLAAITLTLTIVLDTKYGDIPPIGQFLDPFKGFWQNSEEIDPVWSRNLLFEGAINDQVRVIYDKALVPHIFAENDHDLYFAQGYVTAQNRLWQMDFQTRAAAGRISEVIGERAVGYDRLQRRKGLKYGAKQALKEAKNDPEIWSYLQAYSEGVNAYIASLDREDFPLEYKLLDYKPEPWTPLKTFLLLKYLADMLSGHDRDLENTNLMKLLGPEDFNKLFPRQSAEVVPVIPASKEFLFEPLEVLEGNPDYFESFIETPPDNSDENNGSNNWAVSGLKTVNGNAILANDPHLQLNLPSVFFLMQLTSNSHSVKGATLPGGLGVIIGFNDSISWGTTNAERDVRDWYKIDFRDEDRLEYRYDNKWLKTQKMVEVIKVRNADPVIDTIVFTHYGPVTYDESFDGNGSLVNYAMKWTAHLPSMEQKAFLKVNRARNFNDFTNALEDYVCPAQNFAFSSAAGDVGMYIAGKFPLKWENQGKFLMDGSNSIFEWQDFIPSDHNGWVLNPEREYVSSANQVPVDSAQYPYYVYNGLYEDFRNRRINERLEVMENVRPEDLMRLQNDNFSYQANLSLPVMLESFDSAEVVAFETPYRQAYRILDDWDYFFDIDEQAPVIYTLWWDNFYDMIWDELSGKDYALRRPDAYQTIQLMKNDPGIKYYDIENTDQQETMEDLVRNSFRVSVDSLENWKEVSGIDYSWGTVKQTDIVHLLNISAFSSYDIPTGGFTNIINANSFRKGVSLRMIFEMSGINKGWFSLPGGQSGNPGSPYYDNLIEVWQKGDYLSLDILDRDDTGLEKVLLIQTFRPGE